MSEEKKVLKKRGRKPKNIEIPKQENENDKKLQENLIIKLKKGYVDDYNIQSFDKNIETNEKDLSPTASQGMSQRESIVTPLQPAATMPIILNS